MAEEHKPPSKPPATMAATPWTGELPERLGAALGAGLLEASSYLGQNFAIVEPASLGAALEALTFDSGFDYLVDITAVDYPKAERRFEVIYILYSYARNERVRLKVRLADGGTLPSAVPLFTGANWLEREVFDMFGIVFTGHPDLRRILLPEEWTGFPLRKDYGILQMDQRWVRENLAIESGQ